MWQYYVLMSFCVLAVIVGVSNKDSVRTSTLLTPSLSITSVAVGCLMTWLIWSFLSVNWMWLSIGLMAIAILNMVRLTMQVLLERRTIPDNGSGTILAILYGIAYTVFYLKFV